MKTFFFDFVLTYKNSNDVETISAEIQDGIDTSQLQPGTSILLYATKIIAVQWAARRNLRYMNRKGIPALYYEAYYRDLDKLDDATGSVVTAGIQAEQFFRDSTTIAEANARIGYLPPRMIRVEQPNYINQTNPGETGNVYTEQAEITVPAGLYKKWDRLEISNHNWIVIDAPKSVYDNKGLGIEAFKLKCTALQLGEMDY